MYAKDSFTVKEFLTLRVNPQLTILGAIPAQTMAGPLENNLNKPLFAALAMCAPLAATAAPVALDMSCTSTVKAFFAPLIQDNVINPKPFRITAQSSLNHFQPRLLKSMHVYGMPVVEVFGYTNEPLLFVNNGTPMQQDVYGAVVRESIANVQAQLNSMGATSARTVRLDREQTIIICKGEM